MLTGLQRKRTHWRFRELVTSHHTGRADGQLIAEVNTKQLAEMQGHLVGELVWGVRWC